MDMEWRSMGLDGGRSLGVNGNCGKVREKRRRSRLQLGADGAMPWQQQQPSVEAFMLLALLCLFFLAGRRRGGQYVGARTLVSPPEAASSSISMAACWLESGIEVEEVRESWRMERCGSVWAPVLVPSTPRFHPCKNP